MLEHLPAWITAQWPFAIRELFGFSCLFNTMALQGNRREVCEIVRSCYFTNSQSAKSCFLVPLLEILLCSNFAKMQPHFPKGGNQKLTVSWDPLIFWTSVQQTLLCPKGQLQINSATSEVTQCQSEEVQDLTHAWLGKLNIGKLSWQAQLWWNSQSPYFKFMATASIPVWR